jgi:hypothetical protein
MSDIHAAQALFPAVEALLRINVTEATELVIKKAVTEFEAELRRSIAKTALDVSHFYELHRDADNLVITVKNHKREPT